MPENSGSPAIAWPTPTVNGFMKAPENPAPGADRAIARRPPRRSRGAAPRHQAGQERQRLLRHADRAAADREREHDAAG